jgi:benzoylformate decarboxylase
MRTGNHVLLEQLVADGFEYMFGLPGSEEEGFLDALSDYRYRLRYILAYHETIAVMAADGYARASGRPALVQVHSTPGLGNALGGAIWEAKKGHSPLVVIGGKAGIKYLSMDAHMAGEVVAMARPVTKWAEMVTHPASLLRMVRRAVKIATTPPKGPVYLCLPMDVLDEVADEEVIPTCIPSTRVTPDQQLIDQAAEFLARAEKPMIFVGDGVAHSEATPELTEVAELIGAEVWGAHMGDLAMSFAHPLFQGLTGRMFGTSSLPIYGKGDVNLICGTYVVPEVFPELGPIFARGAQVIHIDLDADYIGKNHPVTLGLLSDPKRTLAALAQSLRQRLTPSQKNTAATRTAAIQKSKGDKRAAEIANDRANRSTGRLTFAEFAEELAMALNAAQIHDPVVVDEALTCSPALTRYLVPTTPRHYFLPRGGCLGIGLPTAIGVKIACPTKTVIGVTGDGAAMEVIQSLATAARYGIGAKLIICNNRSYKVCVDNLNAYRGLHNVAVSRLQPESFDLSNPVLDFVKIAEGQGVPGYRVSTAAAVKTGIAALLNSPGPFLLEVEIV